jgi:hypothetical protein
MADHKPKPTKLFTSRELALHIADTLIDHFFFDKSRLKDAIASIKWELDAQHGIGRVELKVAAIEPEKAR